ncbi:hypothetical protein BDP27DRAFT_1458460 [Rhodocollybia butyracea]|uniref:Peptidase M1 leukotriene A4 hydrolase/aminopeptidase C-terminal domain-containing protein n=1 Tax=Rhodocollybia butyracea TaxID=206335 RepID=A0A9P5P407_9AGAR|nr:hypothetical protein BDP27DRAFT_1458460 [Rhodocollybia butyracea]
MSDPTSQANHTEIFTEHCAFKWNVDFTNKKLTGSVTHDLHVAKDGVREVIFDTADLDIYSVEVEGNTVSYEVKAKHPIMGSALHIPLPSVLKSGSSIKRKNDLTCFATSILTEVGWEIVTFTDKVKSLLSWFGTGNTWVLTGQSLNETYPFQLLMKKDFSLSTSVRLNQCHPIYAHAISPIQDSPSVKIKYSAEVTSVLPALMSAIRQSPPSTGLAHDGRVIGKDEVTYAYHQPIPIPSYLIAIAAGNVVYRPFPRHLGKAWTCGIWTEPELIEDAYWEFSEDTSRFLASAEEIVVPYRFGVYDLLVLPPSFPYGGMENSCLTFLTPTLLAGDRTLVDAITHELTHSWFGNGVTHADASHFWLNEGWTTYIERLLLQVLHSPADRGFSFIIGYKALQDDLEMYADKPKYQCLVIEFEKGEDPDDAYSGIPYNKGANLILHLERTLGGLDVFLPYVRDYMSTFMGKGIMTQEWKEHLYTYYEKNGRAEKIKALDSVDWDASKNFPPILDELIDFIYAGLVLRLAERWDSSRSVDISKLEFSENDMNNFMVFLERLQSYKPLSSSHVEHLASLYKVSATHNAEIRLRFYQFSLVDPTSPAAQKYAVEAADWVIVGNWDGCWPDEVL